MCLSVCLSVCHKPVLCRNDRTNLAAIWLGGFLPHIPHCVLRKFGYLRKYGYFPLELCLKIWTLKLFRHGQSIALSTNSSTVELVDDIYDGRRVVAVDYTSVNSNPISLRFVLDLLSSLGSNLVSSFSRSVVCSFFSLCEFQIVIVYDNSFTLSPSCDCGQRQTMNHIVDTCPLTKFECGLNRLNVADDDAVIWLESTATAALAK